MTTTYFAVMRMTLRLTFFMLQIDSHSPLLSVREVLFLDINIFFFYFLQTPLYYYISNNTFQYLTCYLMKVKVLREKYMQLPDLLKDKTSINNGLCHLVGLHQAITTFLNYYCSHHHRAWEQLKSTINRTYVMKKRHNIFTYAMSWH